jgi:hypothetical protein
VIVRLLLLVLLALLVARFLVLLARHAAAAYRAGAAPPARAVPLVACRRCGVHVPRASARSQGDGFLCRTCGGG